MPEEEARGLLKDDGTTPPSSCNACCILRGMLCFVLVLALLGGAGAGFIMSGEVDVLKPKQLSSTNEEADELSKIVLQLVKDHKTKQEARQVAGDAEWGKDLKADSEKIMDLLRAMEGQLSPQVAAKLGIEITSDDIARILDVTGTHGHQFNLEDAKKGAFQGDMVPANDAQLKQFITQAESARHVSKVQRGSFGAGTPWTNGIVRYCFHDSATEGVREAVRLAIAQYKKAVPCIEFNDVGHISEDECEESPAILITSAHSGCWSYVGMFENWQSQELNLQAPGCDSVGTALHELGHALGMGHEQARPDRDEYVEIHEDRIQDGKQHNFDITRGGDTERPYDLLSIMHYDADSFSTSDKPTITAKGKAYELYTTNASEFHYYKMGNRVGLTQLDADQLADLYRAENGLCGSHLLGEGDEHSCSDLLKNGAQWRDKYDQTCENYVKMEARGRIKSCADYSSGRYCCDCGGGLRLQKWSWDCDLCRPVSLNGCGCKPGPWELFGEISYSECGNPGYTNHMPMCVVDESCKDHLRLGGKTLAQCAMYTGFTTKGCRCKRYPKGWTYKGPDGDKFVLNTCGNPNNHKDGPWCNVEENEHECQGNTWGPCEFAKA